MVGGFQWCPRCCANLRDAARYCKICKCDVEAEKTSAAPGVPVRHLIEDARKWFPDLDSLVAMMPESEYKHHLLQAFKQDVSGSFSARPDWNETIDGLLEGNIGLDLQPHPAVVALIFELALEARKAELAIDTIINTPRLRVLGITNDSLNAELSLMSDEERHGRICPFCAENVSDKSRKCRYCESDFDGPPKRKKQSLTDSLRAALAGEFDPAYLRRALLYMAARTARDDANWRVNLQQVLLKNDIAEGEVESAVRETNYYSAEGLGVLNLPLKDWLGKLLSEGLLEDPHYNAVLDLIRLGQTCASDGRYDEADLILESVLRLLEGAESNEALKDAREPLKTICLQALTEYHRKAKNYAEAERYQVRLTQSFSNASSPIMAAVQQTVKRFAGPWMLMTQADLCFKQGKYSEAAALYQEAIAASEESDARRGSMSGGTTQMKDNQVSARSPRGITPAPFSMELYGALVRLADCYLMMEDYQSTERTLAAASAECKQASGPYAVVKWRLKESYGRLFFRQKKYAEAEKCFASTLEWMDSINTPADTQAHAHSTAALLEEHAQCLDKLKRGKEAASQRLRAQDIMRSV